MLRYRQQDQEQGSLQHEGTWKGVSGMFLSPCCARGLSSKRSSPHWKWSATILENGPEHCLHKTLLKNAGYEQGWHFSKRGPLKFSQFEKQMAKDGSLRKKWFLTIGSHCLVKRNWGVVIRKGYGHVQVGVRRNHCGDNDMRRPLMSFNLSQPSVSPWISPLRRNRPDRMGLK